MTVEEASGARGVEYYSYKFSNIGGHLTCIMVRQEQGNLDKVAGRDVFQNHKILCVLQMELFYAWERPSGE